MKNISKYLLMAAMAALALVSCKKDKTPEDDKQKEETEVTYTFSATATSETEADLKVVASAAVPEDVKVAIAVGEGNSIPEAALTFPKELVIAKGKTEAAGKVSVDKEALEPGNGYKAALTASVDGKAIGSASVFSIDIPEPEPQGPVTLDGDASEWASLPAGYVTELVCAEDAELSGLKSAKVFYDDKIYGIIEVSDEAISAAAGKIRFHIYFDNGNNADAGYKGAIDCMMEGKMQNGGAWCAIGSQYYLWQGTDPTVWSGSWGGNGVTPEFAFAGQGNLYEFAMDYSTYPDGLADVIGIGFDIQDGDYTAMGYLPSNAPVAQVVKNGAEKPKVITIDGNMADWNKVTNGISDEEGVLREFKVAFDEDYLYFYNKRTWTDALWGSSYYYYEFDTDNNAETSVADVNGNTPCGGIDAWVYLTLFKGSSSAPAFAEAPTGGSDKVTMSDIIAAGVTDGALVETEVRIPRANVGVKKGDTIRIWSWGNKSGSNLKTSEGVTVVLDK